MQNIIAYDRTRMLMIFLFCCKLFSSQLSFLLQRLAIECLKLSPLVPARSMRRCNNTFSIRSIVCCRSMPKSMKVHSIPSRLYSSCSRMNIWWLKNCWSFSLVKLIQSCSKLLYCSRPRRGKATEQKTEVKDSCH